MRCFCKNEWKPFVIIMVAYITAQMPKPIVITAGVIRALEDVLIQGGKKRPYTAN
ncbi:MAG TPA: hypothetical protein VMU13_01730 [Candidatus Paceibacterota bacterium]|nr:hypothetical protein [Candidatus Paceibacterota bacterium]